MLKDMKIGDTKKIVFSDVFEWAEKKSKTVSDEKAQDGPDVDKEIEKIKHETEQDSKSVIERIC